jgi:hypothetical protein
MKAIGRVIAALAVVAMFGTAAQAETLNVRRFAAFSASNQHTGLAAVSNASRRGKIDPILQGAGPTTIPAGKTSYFSALSDALDIHGCRAVLITHADGNVFDPANTGQLLALGLDVAAVFFDELGKPVGGAFLAASSPNGPLHSAGFVATSPQAVRILIGDLPASADSIAFLVEGDATNMDTKAHDVGATVLGILTLNCVAM